MEIGALNSYGTQKQSGESKQNTLNMKSQPGQDLPIDGERNYSRQEIQKEIDGLNKWMQSTNTHLKFTLHERLNEYYVQVIDDENNVIREIPPKKILDMVAKMHEMIGLLIDEKR
ncbi:flagellar protein FlaG [Brevibacillus thermoruber]|uniref:flagellar protein FlaG n=1 Tax=Brevibacillus thermoruber TaxID=33942 RepID=UPI00055522B9|nr:flagellar protein FlaG [Brevibacillus thermoruber]